MRGDDRAVGTSETHDLAVLRQDNGELQEDVVATSELDRDDGGADERREAEADEESEESFPASDPPSHWAGGDTDADNAAEALASRVVDRRPADDVPERRHPADPVPGTLPRH